MRRSLIALLSLAFAGCGGEGSVTDTIFSNPRAEQSAQCSTDKDYSGRGLPFHTLPIDNGNDFNTTNESFQTSTPGAQTPYVAYASWDPCNLYFGYTGSAIGAGDCPDAEGENCKVHDLAENPYTYLLLYIDTDPTTDQGTDRPKSDRGPAPAKLPFRADFLVEIRTDGETIQTGDGFSYQGNAQLLQRKSGWQSGLEKEWVPTDEEVLTIGDNSSSNFIEFSIPRSALGDPCAVQVVGWVAETRKGEAWAYWPPPRNAAVPSRPDSMRADSSRQGPSGPVASNESNQSASDSASAGSSSGASGSSGGGQADTTRSGSGAMASNTGAQSDTTTSNRTQTASRQDSTQKGGARTGGRDAVASADSLVLDYYGFVLLPDQQPNAQANLNRSDYGAVREGCNAPSGAERSALPGAQPLAPWALGF